MPTSAGPAEKLTLAYAAGPDAMTTFKEEEAMQYLLLIYDNEKRWSQGYDKSELGEYVAFGKEFAPAIIRGQRAAADQHCYHGARTERQACDN